MPEQILTLPAFVVGCWLLRASSRGLSWSEITRQPGRSGVVLDNEQRLAGLSDLKDRGWVGDAVARRYSLTPAGVAGIRTAIAKLRAQEKKISPQGRFSSPATPEGRGRA